MRAKHSRAVLALILASGLAGTAVCSAADAPATAASQPANAVRPEFAKPFNEAQELLKAGKGPEALAKLKEAAALPNPTPYEQFLIVRVRAPAEYAAGDTQAATTDFETVLASDQVLAADKLPIMKALSQIVYNNKQYDKCVTWSQRFFDAGGEDAQLHEILAQCQYLMKDYAPAAKAYKTIIDAQYAAGQRPTEQRLRVLASAQSQIHDDAGYMQTIEHLAVDYPTADYWQQLISRAAHVEKLADRQYVDVYRMKAAIYGQVAPEEILSFAGLSARAGYPAEAKHVLDDGFARKAFPAADVGEATKLLPQVTRLAAQDRAQNAANESAAKAAKDGNAAANLGLLDTLDGNPQQGIALISLGIEKGGLKFPDEAKLHLGMAQYAAGQLPDALKTFQSASGPSGVGSLARVWSLFVQSKMQTTTAAK